MGGWLVGWLVKAQAKELSFDVLSDFSSWSDLYVDKKMGVRALSLIAGAAVVNKRGISLSRKDLISLGPHPPFLYPVVLLCYLQDDEWWNFSLKILDKFDGSVIIVYYYLVPISWPTLYLHIL